MYEVEEKPAKSEKPAKGEKQTKSEKQKSDDDVAKPKKVLTAFLCYTNQNRPKLMNENPDMKITEVTKLTG